MRQQMVIMTSVCLTLILYTHVLPNQWSSKHLSKSMHSITLWISQPLLSNTINSNILIAVHKTVYLCRHETSLS